MEMVCDFLSFSKQTGRSTDFCICLAEELSLEFFNELSALYCEAYNSENWEKLKALYAEDSIIIDDSPIKGNEGFESSPALKHLKENLLFISSSNSRSRCTAQNVRVLDSSRMRRQDCMHAALILSG